jgi:hypothetical protein
MKRASLFAAITLILTVLATDSAISQSPANTSPAPANAWMRTPTRELDRTKQTGTVTRAERDQFWDKSIIAQRAPLTADTAGRSELSEGSWGPNPPEIATFPDRTILIAKFTSFQSILTESGRALYTDIILQVVDVIQGPHASPDTQITVSVPGGTVETSSGQVISYLTRPQNLFLQPARTYIMVLSYQKLGDFYRLGNNWDITNGVVKPNTHFDQMIFEQGRSSISGQNKEEAIKTPKQRASESQ